MRDEFWQGDAEAAACAAAGDGGDDDGDDDGGGGEEESSEDDDPPPIPDGWEPVPFGKPFSHFLMWTKLTKKKTEVPEWRRWTVLRELGAGRSDGFTHDAHLDSENSRKKRGVGLTQDSYDSGLWLGIQEKGTPPPPPPPPPLPAQLSPALPPPVPTPPSKWSVMPTPKNGKIPYDVDCPPTPLVWPEEQAFVRGFQASQQQRGSKRPAPSRAPAPAVAPSRAPAVAPSRAPAVASNSRWPSRVVKQMKPFTPNDNNDGFAKGGK